MSRQIDFSEFAIVDQENGNLVVEHENGSQFTLSQGGSLGADSVLSIEYVSASDDLQSRLDEHGDSPSMYIISEGTYTAPTYGFTLYDNTIIKGDREKAVVEANAPDGSGTGADKYAFQNEDNHQAGSGDHSGNPNIHIEGLTVRGQIRITCDSSSYTPKNVTLRDLDCIDTDSWQVFLMGYEGVRVDNVFCSNWDAGTDPGGNDGVHLIDCNRATITGVYGHTGDDLLSLGIRNRTAEGIVATGIHGQSEKANAVKLHGNSSATGYELRNVYVNGVWSDSCNHLVSTDMTSGSVKYLTVDTGWCDSPLSMGFNCASSDAHITLRNIYVTNSANKGMNLVGSNHKVINCHLSGTQATSAVGIDMQASDSIIRDCTVDGFTSHGIAAQGVNTLVEGGYIDSSSGGRPVWPNASDVRMNDVTYTGGVPGPDTTGFLLDGVGEESANAETPQYTWPRGAIVDFTDSGDGSGNGLYLIDRSQTARQIGS